MKDKEIIEQILEKVGVYNGSDMGGKTYIVRPQDLEQEILKHYQPKIPEGAVVLTREEYKEMVDDVKVSKEKLARIIDSAKVKARKETARVILNEIGKASNDKRYDIWCELCEKYGVEV